VQAIKTLATHPLMLETSSVSETLVFRPDLCPRTSYHYLTIVTIRHCHIITLILSFIHQWLYSPLLGPGLFFSFIIFFTQAVGVLGLVIRLSQDCSLHRGLHKHRINAHTDIHALSGIRKHYDSSIRGCEDRLCLRPRGHCDRQSH
jgi:hypothetical protein